MNKNKYAEFCIMCIRFVGKKLCARIENVCAVGVVGAVAYKHHSPNELFRAKNKRKKKQTINSIVQANSQNNNRYTDETNDLIKIEMFFFSGSCCFAMQSTCSSFFLSNEEKIIGTR